MSSMQKNRPEALSIPNLITYVRLLLIPAFVACWFEERLWLALGCLALSALSDVADGFIARRFHMITDLGKAIDPVADKLTQAAMFFCLAWDLPEMWILLGFLVVKELVMLAWGIVCLRRTDTIPSAKWYGKVCTAVLYASMAALVLLPGLSRTGKDVILALCGAVMLMSLVLYSRWYLRLLREAPGSGLGPKLKETRVVRSSAPFAALWMMLVVLAACAVLAAVYKKAGAALVIAGLAAVVLLLCLWLRKHRVRTPEKEVDLPDEYPE